MTVLSASTIFLWMQERSARKSASRKGMADPSIFRNFNLTYFRVREKVNSSKSHVKKQASRVW